MTIQIEPGDRQVDVVIALPNGCPMPAKARVRVLREGEATIQDDIEVREVAA